MRVHLAAAIAAMLLAVPAAAPARAQEPATPTAATGYAALVTGSPGLAAYWRLDEPSGDVAADSSGNGRDAQYAPNVQLGLPGLIAAENAAIGLDGSADAYVDAGDVLDFPGTTPFTLELWVRPADYEAPYPRLIQKEATDENGRRQGYLLYLNKETGRLGLERWRDGEVDVVTSPDRLPIDAISHVVAVFDGAAIRLYVDGQGVAEGPADRELADNPYPFRIGIRTDGASPFEGVVDEVAIYDEALDSERIRAHYEAGVGAGLATPAAVPQPATTPVAGPTPAATVAPRATTARPTAAAIERATAVPTDAPPTEAPPAETPAAETPAAAPATAVTIDDLNLRAGPSTDTEVLTVIAAGSTVVLTGEAVEGFVSVEYEGLTGWVSSDFLDFGEAAPDAAAP